MKTIYEVICGIIFVLLNVTLVSVVYYYNRHPIRKYGNKRLSPDELAELITKEIGGHPEYYTYEKKDNGKYCVYALSHTDNLTYEEKEFDYPVNLEGVPVKPLTEVNFQLKHTENGFKVPGIKQWFNCPEDYYWEKNSMKCIEKPICDEYNDSVKPLYNRYYAEIDNPSITAVTPLTGDVPHPRLYIRCSSSKKKPIINACSEENEKFNINPSDSESKNISINPCKIYDVCNDYPEDTRHAYRINNDFSEALKVNEYYVCEGFKSERRECQKGYECNEKYQYKNDICKPINDCRPNIDYYFTTNPNSFSFCLSNKRQEKCCGENGIIKLKDNSYDCKTDKYVYYHDNKEDELNEFKYKFKINKGLQKTMLSLVLFDDWFNEKFPNEMLTYSSLPKTPINYYDTDGNTFEYEAGGKRDYFENDQDMRLPTKFYYAATEDEIWKLFADSEKINLLQSLRKFTEDSKKIRLSASNAMYEVSAKIKNSSEYYDNVERINPDDYYEINLIPEDYGLQRTVSFWIIHRGYIYKYSSARDETTKFDISKEYYSFIGAIITEPKKIIRSEIIAQAFRDTEGIYYTLCLKHDNNTFTYNNNQIVYHKNLSILLDGGKNPVNDEINSKLSLDLNNLMQNNILSSNFPRYDFSWDKLFVGKYYYDKEKGKLVVWHDHLFVIKLMPFITDKLNKRVGLIIDDKGQFKYPNYPTNIVDITFNNINDDKYKSNKYLTALATTFNYYNHNYETPVVHWLSYIPLDPAVIRKFNDTENKNELLNTEFSILNYLTISYPVLKQSTIMETLINILCLKPFTLTFD